VRVEPVVEHELAAHAQDRADHTVETEHMRQRQPGVGDGAGIKARVRRVDEAVARRRKVAVAEHHRLGQTRDAAGVEHNGRVVLLDVGCFGDLGRESREVVRRRQGRANGLDAAGDLTRRG
jgi:hypothetical protein